ncbi:hypothetical protein BC829DRAFT_444678 [Chytridium lagenaria]|nr:hypothetical protein BC829DRAFT_444678 [Chytridium lagenaria]
MWGSIFKRPSTPSLQKPKNATSPSREGGRNDGTSMADKLEHHKGSPNPSHESTIPDLAPPLPTDLPSLTPPTSTYDDDSILMEDDAIGMQIPVITIPTPQPSAPPASTSIPLRTPPLHSSTLLAHSPESTYTTPSTSASPTPSPSSPPASLDGASPRQSTDLDFDHHVAHPPLLFESLATGVSVVAHTARVSIAAAAAVSDVALATAKWGTALTLGMGRSILVGALSSARLLHRTPGSHNVPGGTVVAIHSSPLPITLGGESAEDGGIEASSDRMNGGAMTVSMGGAGANLAPNLTPNGTMSRQSRPADLWLFHQALDTYTDYSVGAVNHLFSLAELFTCATWHLARSSVRFTLRAAQETVQIFDGIFGSTETSRALSALVQLIRDEMNDLNDGRGSLPGNGILGKTFNTIVLMGSLTKALTAFACLQVMTSRRTLEARKLTRLYEGIVATGGGTETGGGAFGNDMLAGPPSTLLLLEDGVALTEDPNIFVAADGHVDGVTSAGEEVVIRWHRDDGHDGGELTIEIEEHKGDGNSAPGSPMPGQRVALGRTASFVSHLGDAASMLTLDDARSFIEEAQQQLAYGEDGGEGVHIIDDAKSFIEEEGVALASSASLPSLGSSAYSMHGDEPMRARGDGYGSSPVTDHDDEGLTFSTGSRLDSQHRPRTMRHVGVLPTLTISSTIPEGMSTEDAEARRRAAYSKRSMSVASAASSNTSSSSSTGYPRRAFDENRDLMNRISRDFSGKDLADLERVILTSGTAASSASANGSAPTTPTLSPSASFAHRQKDLPPVPLFFRMHHFQAPGPPSSPSPPTPSSPTSPTFSPRRANPVSPAVEGIANYATPHHRIGSSSAVATPQGSISGISTIAHGKDDDATDMSESPSFFDSSAQASSFTSAASMDRARRPDSTLAASSLTSTNGGGGWAGVFGGRRPSKPVPVDVDDTESVMSFRTASTSFSTTETGEEVMPVVAPRKTSFTSMLRGLVSPNRGSGKPPGGQVGGRVNARTAKGGMVTMFDQTSTVEREADGGVTTRKATIRVHDSQLDSAALSNLGRLTPDTISTPSSPPASPVPHSTSILAGEAMKMPGRKQSSAPRPSLKSVFELQKGLPAPATITTSSPLVLTPAASPALTARGLDERSRGEKVEGDRTPTRSISPETSTPRPRPGTLSPTMLMDEGMGNREVSVPNYGHYPLRNLLRNLERYARFATAAYGRDLMILLGVGKIRDIHTTDPRIHANHYAFAIHTGVAVNDIVHSSFDNGRDPAAAAPLSPRMQPLNHYVVLDRAAKVVVVALRGTLGLSDVLTDMRFDYAEFGGGRVHAGMLRSAAMKFRRGTEVFKAVDRALRENPGYGLVVTGHSLGGGVAVLMAMEWSCPVSTLDDAVMARSARTPFVTSPSSGLPAGRPIHCYSYGSPCVATLDLSASAKGLVSTLVNGDDIVPTISLGLIRDFKIVTMSLLDPANKGLSERIISRTLGLQRGATASTPAPPTDISSETTTPEVSPIEEEEFFWSIITRLRQSMNSERLYPAGLTYWMNAAAVTETTDVKTGTKKSVSRVVLQRCDDVKEMFSEPMFSPRVMSDHTPKSYEDALEALGKAVFGGRGGNTTGTTTSMGSSRPLSPIA